MFGRRCSLCNGKLNSRNICKECGLDNSKSEKYYKINQSSCDNLPMTHVHEVERSKKKRKEKVSYHQETPIKKAKKKDQDKEKKNKISILVTLLILVIGAIPSALGIFESETHTSAEPEYYSESYNPYEYLETELPQFGDTLMYTLRSGQYVVGVHIAEGYYKATVFNEYDSIEVTDGKNGIYLYEYPAKDGENYLDDLRLFAGAVITVTSQDGIRLDTENGQSGEMPALAENFVTDKYVLHSYYEAEAGIDFEPGIYDIVSDTQYAHVNLTIYDENGTEWDFRDYDLGTEGIYGPNFRNVVIPEGAVIRCEEVDVELVPSEWIWTTDYLEHYY